MNESSADHDRRLIAVGASVQSATMAKILRVESSFGKGYAGIQIIGNSGQIVEDGKERARIALERLGLVMPAKRMMISISPGDVKVDGNHLDLACAVAIAGQIIEQKALVDTSRWVFAAEIGLGGELRPVPGAVCHGVAAMAGGLDGVVVSKENLPELRALEAVSAKTGKRMVYRSFSHLHDVVAWLWDGAQSEDGADIQDVDLLPDLRASFADMNLTDDLRLIAMTAAAGMHSVFLRGAPGCGKSMFAQRLVTLLPLLAPEEHLASLQTYSAHPHPIADDVLSGRPPFRAPHHFTSTAAMLGSGDRPGEVALASGGVLFLDEFPEFRRDVIEALREPLETGEVQVSRAQTKRVWRARAMFVAAANNCPCGWRGSRTRKCTCAENRVAAYQGRISGPVLDRIDIHVNMPELGEGHGGIFSTSGTKLLQSVESMKTRVAAARERAICRNASFQVLLNRDIPPQHLARAFQWNAEDLEHAIKEFIPAHVSVRSTTRCLRVARTVADVYGADKVELDHLLTAWGWQSFEASLKRGDSQAHLANLRKGPFGSRSGVKIQENMPTN